MIRKASKECNGTAEHARNGTAPPTPEADQEDGKLHGHRLTTFQPLTREWLLPGRVSFGSLVILGGDKQAGKSTFAGAIAASLSGSPVLLPGQSAPVRSGTVWVTSEEDPRYDVLPRIRAMGGDPSKVIIVGRDPRGRRPRMPRLPSEWETLGEMAADSGSRFVLVDGIASMLPPGLRLTDEGQAREVFDPAAEVAERFKIVIKVIRHNRKAAASTGFGQILGSVGVCGAARTVLQIRVLDRVAGLRAVTTETNQGAPPLPLLCRIADKGGVGALSWEGECQPDDKRIEDAAPDAGRVRQGAAAEAFVAAFLKDVGEVNAKDVFAEGLRDGYGSDALWRAATRIGVVIRRDGFGPGSSSKWSLPKPEEVRPVEEVRSMQSMAKPRAKRARKPRKTP